MSAPSDRGARLAVFLHSGDYDRMHQGLSVAAAAVAQGRAVDIFLFWWALQRVGAEALDEPEFGPEHQAVADRFERRGMPSLRALLDHLRESQLSTLYACTGSMAIIEPQQRGIEKWVDRFVGWSTILQLTHGVTDRFYL